MTKFHEGDITLRQACIEDADILLRWRNDPVTREASIKSNPIPLQEHLTWLKGVIENPDRHLFVAEEKNIPFGTVRADRSDDSWQLSWAVSNSFRRRGLAKLMVRLLADNLEGEIMAEIKIGNLASVRVAEYAGLCLDYRVDGIMYFSRKCGT